MSTLVVDPGINGCGVSVWAGRVARLIEARYVPATCTTGAVAERVAHVAERVVWAMRGHDPIERVVTEWPRIYRHGRGGAPSVADDLMPLVGIGGFIAGMLRKRAEWVAVRPDEWKGQLPKPRAGAPYIVESRARARLAPDELARVHLPIASLAHNVWDAVGIGLHHLGRFAPVRVYPR